MGQGWGLQAPERRHCCVTKRPEVPSALGIYGERFPIPAGCSSGGPAASLAAASASEKRGLFHPIAAGRCLPLTLPIRERAQASPLTLVLPGPSHDADLEGKGPALLPSVLRARRWAPEPPSSPPQELQSGGGALMSGLQRAPPRARQGCLNQMPPTQVFLVLCSPISHRLGLDCGPGPFLA